METDIINLKQKIKRELADFLGVDMEDIEDDTVLREDLHMDPTSLTDFFDLLSKAGYDVDSLDLTEVETFADLTDSLTAHV